MATREVYARAPLVYVACEIRYPTAPRMNRSDTFEALTEAFATTLPVPRPEKQALLIGPDTPMATQTNLRFVDPTTTRSVAVSQSAMVVETTDYPGWEVFRTWITEAIDVVAQVGSIVGVTRVGLRYVNEIRVDDPIDRVEDWACWVSPSIIQPAVSTTGGAVSEFQVLVQSQGDAAGDLAPTLTTRYALLHGSGVISDDPLRKVHQRGDGPFFLIDNDSHVAFDASKMLSFDSGTLMPVLTGLHDPVDGAFESAITDELRNELRKEHL